MQRWSANFSLQKKKKKLFLILFFSRGTSLDSSNCKPWTKSVLVLALIQISIIRIVVCPIPLLPEPALGMEGRQKHLILSFRNTEVQIGKLLYSSRNSCHHLQAGRWDLFAVECCIVLLTHTGCRVCNANLRPQFPTHGTADPIPGRRTSSCRAERPKRLYIDCFLIWRAFYPGSLYCP